MVVGIDSVEIDRIEKSIENERFLERVFGNNELIELRDNGTRAERCAALFAVKEAFSKAIGTGVRGFSLSEVQMLHDENGKPYLSLSGNAAKIAKKLGYSFEVSVTHTRAEATAIVIGTK